jgi:YHS domain-containing protein
MDILIKAALQIKPSGGGRTEMNATFRFAVKSCLLTAVSGVLLNQVVGFAQDGNSSSPTIRRTATYQDAPSSSGQQPTSEVQRQLQELYRKDGREMPSMNIEDLPNTQATAMPPSTNGQIAPSAPQYGSNRTPAKIQKPNFFERLFRVGRARKQPATPLPARSPTVTVQPPRYAPLPQQYTSQPTYNSAPVTAAPGPRAVPAREAALPNASSNVPRTTPIPGAVKQPTPRTGISPPVQDDEESNSDSETLELDGDDQAAGSQAPQILPSQTANGPVDSPYSGLRIAPLDEEQKFHSSPSTALEGAPRDGWKPSRTEPAPLEPAHDATAVPETNSDDELETRVEADDASGDDDEHLTLPAGPKHPAGDSAEKSAQRKSSEDTVEHPEIDEPPAPAPMKGFRGYCPVALKDERKLIEALPDFESEYHGKLYTFSSAEAKTIFDMNPRKYVPAGEGTDVVRRMGGEKGVSGTLEHAAWYRGRLYLFASAETRNTFVDSPSKFLADD